jgi:type I restriction enzyme S subunit
MSKWQKVKLGELYEVHNGLSKGREFFGSGYPFLTFSTVFNNWFLPKKLDSLVQSSDKEREACSIRKGDVFITRTSETMNELGMSSVALCDYPNATYNGFTKRLRPITDNVIPEYIGYYLRSPKFRGKFMAFSTMTTRASLANGDLLGMEVELPNKETQQRIAQLLFRYDSLIENYQKQIKLLEESAQRLYKEWFVDLNFPGYESTKVVDGVPEGWEKKKISDVCETIGGGTPSTKVSSYYDGGSISWVTPTDITKNNSLCLLSTEKKITKEGLNHSSAKMLPAEAILMTSRASVGYFGICDFEVCTNQGFISCVPFEKNFQMYLLYNLINRVDEIRIKAGGSTYLEISKSVFRNFEIICPSNNLVTGFQQVTHRLLERTRIIAKQIRLLTEARDRLLPKLMNGEISVETAQSVTSGLGVRKEHTGSPQATDS